MFKFYVITWKQPWYLTYSVVLSSVSLWSPRSNTDYIAVTKACFVACLWNFPIGVCVSIPEPQSVVLFQEAFKRPLGARALLGQVGFWGWAWTPFFLGNVLATPSSQYTASSWSCHNQCYCDIGNQSKSFFPWAASSWYFVRLLR